MKNSSFTSRAEDFLRVEGKNPHPTALPVKTASSITKGKTLFLVDGWTPGKKMRVLKGREARRAANSVCIRKNVTCGRFLEEVPMEVIVRTEKAGRNAKPASEFKKIKHLFYYFVLPDD